MTEFLFLAGFWVMLFFAGFALGIAASSGGWPFTRKGEADDE
jgi:hypothetical protein